ncbi:MULTISPECIES: Nif3-like dinuclear metal center hexameric protein [unclassified Actinomyces]|uniref:Nif3-like dinuclear metal center hexameric protein n=3 Tax=Actinomyces TaxID=1654 RepID=UPI0020170BC4|nr:MULTISPECIES: Nif3-like dinuclear metal center hexameric protein [unclassified Actinomyces]MCL3777948.1 Nif3-like dinuclear metal center hexameric protein [Actinomyces sp. AC-20-1]MCL3788828.1 Nif3-like dinuclear metal center hexameric protein [Actinomyces sp. 187325]MCL3791164.1 Nif3-like dinuclear metal center hexameric protein [Actinomyces sp. 186855]MCL3793725.1 Nif3-like dinuclear metal center hexameric protein [Actinomyces sp. 217892]
MSTTAPSEQAPLTVADVVDILRRAAPPELAEPWDSNQLICGDPAETVRTVLLAVDPLPPVVDEAIETGVDMVITHHPLFLRGTDHVSATTAKGRSIHRLIRAGIALANAHTTWDCAAGGNADALATAVGLTSTTVLSPSSADPALGIGRVGRLPQSTTLRALAERVAAALPDSAPGLLVGGDPDAEVSLVAVSGGSGDSLLGAARQAGADVFLTADLRHHPATDHLADGRPYLLCGTHWATEWVGLAPLAARLEAGAARRGRTLTTRVSQVVTDPWTLRLSTGS